MIIRSKHIKNIIIISPHYDDAYLSLGGFIGSIKEDYYKLHVTIIIVFGRVVDHKSEEKENTQSIRMKEEIENALKYDIELKIFDINDSPLRGHQKRIGPKMRRYPNQYVISMDEKVVENIINYFYMQRLDSSYLLLFPLSIGSHVDHQIARKVGNCLQNSATYSVGFYEDMPYFTFSTIASSTLGLEEYYLIADIREKIKSILTYKSQNSKRWVAPIIDKLYTFDNLNIKYERIWM